MGSSDTKKLAYVALACKRIKNILRERWFCSLRQLEIKISEAGPFNQRVDPHHISAALKQLTKEKVIVPTTVDQVKYYSLKKPSVPVDKIADRARRITQAHKTLLQITKDKNLCGNALEHIVNDALARSENYVRVGDSRTPVDKWGGIVLPGSLDSIQLVKIPPGYLLALEAKNIREWMYAQSVEIWGFMNKVALLATVHPNVQPIFVARKIQYETRLVFRQLGVLGYETRRQYFHPSTEPTLTDVRDKNGLGYHDICFDTEPPEQMVRFFEKTVPAQIKTYSEQFHSMQEKIARHAPDLASNLHGPRRTARWHRFLTEEKIFYPDEEDEEDGADGDYEPDYDDYDYEPDYD